MILVYLENGEHITLRIEKIETTICDDDLAVTYFDGFDKKEKIIEKEKITSINVEY